MDEPENKQEKLIETAYNTAFSPKEVYSDLKYLRTQLDREDDWDVADLNEHIIECISQCEHYYVLLGNKPVTRT